MGSKLQHASLKQAHRDLREGELGEHTSPLGAKLLYK